ncbi:hypothetical protein [Spiroplasma endosymbiont of Amphibalanus improvisus]|uniref:hypothetical protein n=1 Tax=Spiroplasma endosymbiont of Amphibalanus improvisus TaxID=3066327 RepID=UPI00313DFE45
MAIQNYHYDGYLPSEIRKIELEKLANNQEIIRKQKLYEYNLKNSGRVNRDYRKRELHYKNHPPKTPKILQEREEFKKIINNNKINFRLSEKDVEWVKRVEEIKKIPDFKAQQIALKVIKLDFEIKKNEIRIAKQEQKSSLFNK